LGLDCGGHLPADHASGFSIFHIMETCIKRNIGAYLNMLIMISLL